MPEPESVLDRLEENARYVVESKDMFMTIDGRELRSLIAALRTALETLERISDWRGFRHTGEVRDSAQRAAEKIHALTRDSDA